MTSRPAVGIQQPPQQRNAVVARATLGSQSTTQPSSSTLKGGRKRPLDAEGPTQVKKQRTEDGQTTSSTLRSTLAVLGSNSVAPSPSSDGASPSSVLLSQSGSTGDTEDGRNIEQTTPFPSRPGQNAPRGRQAARPEIDDSGVVQKSELRLYTGEAPAMAKVYPQSRKCCKQF